MPLALLSPTLSALGWTLLHSVWQGLLACALYRVGRRLTQIPAARYTCGNIALLLFVLAQAVSFYLCCTRAPSSGSIVAPFAAHDATLPTTQRALLMVLPDERFARLVQLLDPWTPLAACVWASGLVLRATGVFGSLLIIRHQVRRGRPIADPILQRLRAVARRLPLRRLPQFIEVASLTVPATAGWVTPLVLLPASWASNVPVGQLEAIVLHELAHIARNDFLGGLLRSFLNAAYFFHPAVRSVVGDLTQDAEEAADALAADAHGSRKAYAQALLDLELSRRENALLLGASGGNLRQRIVRLATRRAEGKGHESAAVSGTFAACVLIMCLVGFAARTRAAEVRDLEWIASRDLTRSVLALMSKDVENPDSIAAIREAVSELHSGRPVSTATFDRLTETLTTAVNHDACLSEMANATPPFTKAALPSFGSVGERRKLVEALVSYANHQPSGTPTSSRAHRAALILASLDMVDLAGVRVTSLVQNNAFRASLQLSRDDERLLLMAVAKQNERTQRVFELLRDSLRTDISASERTALTMDLSAVPSAQAMLRTSQDSVTEKQLVESAKLMHDGGTHVPGDLSLLVADAAAREATR